MVFMKAISMLRSLAFCFAVALACPQIHLEATEPISVANRFELSNQYAQRFSGKVFRQSVRLNYFGPNETYAWYRVETGPQTVEYVFVDTAKKSRETLFTGDQLADALATATGEPRRDLAPRPSTLRFSEDLSRVNLRILNRNWQWIRATRELVPLETSSVESNANEDSLTPLESIRPSTSGGDETRFEFENRLDETVRLFWVPPSGPNRHYADISAGKRWETSTYEGHVWLVTDMSDQPLAAFRADLNQTLAYVDKETPKPQSRRGRNPGQGRGGRSTNQDAFLTPNKLWRIEFENHNIKLVSASGDQSKTLTSDGSVEDSYEGTPIWSPDGNSCVITRTKRPTTRRITLVESAPEDQLQPKTVELDYAKPGDEIEQRRPYLIHLPKEDQAIETASIIVIDNSLFPNPYQLNQFRWEPDSSEFSFVYNERGHQVLRVISVDRETGNAKSTINEESETFVCYSHKFFLERFSDPPQWIWMSERDGWNHLYRIDPKTGEVLNPITQGPWVVREVVRVDSEAQQIWFTAGGLVPGEDPYYLHLARVNFDGTGLTRLTDGDGTHRWEYSPEGRWLLDTFSRVDLPPVTTLRDASTGELVCELETADWSELRNSGWNPPERFVAKGRDGETDIYGIMIRPSDFDPSLTYPVLEAMYAGPHSAFTPKSFGLYRDLYEMAEMGFIVVKLDGMGTSHRSKAFHDVCWKNLADAGFPDRIAWMRAAAEKYPEFDLSRVGIWGGSAGGQSSLGALLFHGDFYHAAAADCGCHDNRMDKIWWNEQWMGWPIGPHYESQSNVTNAHRLQGKLLLTVGAMDRNVDPASTMQVVEALIKANKDFELIVFPSGGHGIGSSPYGIRRMKDFFIRSLGVPVPKANP